LEGGNFIVFTNFNDGLSGFTNVIVGCSNVVLFVTSSTQECEGHPLYCIIKEGGGGEGTDIN
jgi:hypothetical protein